MNLGVAVGVVVTGFVWVDVMAVVVDVEVVVVIALVVVVVVKVVIVKVDVLVVGVLHPPHLWRHPLPPVSPVPRA